MTAGPTSGSGKNSNVFPDVEFESNLEFAQYTGRAAALLRTMALELHFDATVARARMGGIAPVIAGANVRAKVRARNTTTPLYKAVEALIVAAEQVAEAQRRFDRNYSDEVEAAGGKRGSRRGGPAPMRIEG